MITYLKSRFVKMTMINYHSANNNFRSTNNFNTMISTRLIFFIVCSFILGYQIALVKNISNTLQHTIENDECMLSFGTYHGHKYESSQTIGSGKCLIQSKWMQVMQHTVDLDTNNSDNKELINDWLFIDYHDRINVLVQHNPEANRDKNEIKFLIFEQTKYALEGRTSLAVVGGIIEPNEEPESAAKREVQEEFNGLICNKFLFLGRFRTDVNRGMGWVNSYLASDCHDEGPLNHESVSSSGVTEEVGHLDTEKQKIISMTLSELRKSVQEGMFLEVQWSNTVSLALLSYV